MFATVNGVRLHYEVEGRGEPAILPSFAGTASYRHTFSSPRLREHFRLIFLDLRTSSPSELGPPDAIAIDTLVDDMDAVRDALGLERVGIIGHSYHGLLALAYALKYPRRAARLVVVGSAPGPRDAALNARYWDTMASAERKALLTARRAALRERDPAGGTPQNAHLAGLAALGPQRFCDPTFDMTPWFAGTVYDVAGVERLFAEFRGYDPSPRLGEIACPVFVAAGWHDYPDPPLAWAGHRERLPNCTYHAFERSGHYPHWEEQESFDAKVIAWLNERT